MPALVELASIHPDVQTRAYWEFVKARELRFQKCEVCGAFRFPPLSGCRDCGASQSSWVAVAGRGRVFSYTVVHHPAIPEVREDVPYAVVVVEFDDAARASFRAVADGLTATWRGTIIPADVYDLALRERNAFRASR